MRFCGLCLCVCVCVCVQANVFKRKSPIQSPGRGGALVSHSAGGKLLSFSFGGGTICIPCHPPFSFLLLPAEKENRGNQWTPPPGKVPTRRRGRRTVEIKLICNFLRVLVTEVECHLPVIGYTRFDLLFKIGTLLKGKPKSDRCKKMHAELKAE